MCHILQFIENNNSAIFILIFQKQSVEDVLGWDTKQIHMMVGAYY